MTNSFSFYASRGASVLSHICHKYGYNRSNVQFLDTYFCGIVGLVVNSWAGRQLDSVDDFLACVDDNFLLSWTEDINRNYDYGKSLKDNGIIEADIVAMFLQEAVEALH